MKTEQEKEMDKIFNDINKSLNNVQKVAKRKLPTLTKKEIEFLIEHASYAIIWQGEAIDIDDKERMKQITKDEKTLEKIKNKL